MRVSEISFENPKNQNTKKRERQNNKRNNFETTRKENPQRGTLCSLFPRRCRRAFSGNENGERNHRKFPRAREEIISRLRGEHLAAWLAAGTPDGGRISKRFGGGVVHGLTVSFRAAG